MRNLVIAEIKNIQDNPCNKMRWSYMSIKLGVGFVYERTKKSRKVGSQVVSLSSATRADFEELSDEALLVLLTAMIRQASKQM